MAININLKVVPFGEIIYHTLSPAAAVEESAAIHEPEPTRYYVPTETAPKVLEIRYEKDILDYGAPTSIG